MRTADFEFELPAEQIAQQPAEPRDSSRLLVLDRNDGSLAHHHFWDLPELLQPGDLLVLNVTRVLPARIPAVKTGGRGKAEILLVRRLEPQTWEALVGGRRIVPGLRLTLPDGSLAEVKADLGGPRRVLYFDRPLGTRLAHLGHTPLPPYIEAPLSDPERYQTVFGREPGSIAAPTAGLHFTPQLLKRLEDRGIERAEVTLHIGLDTFAPVRVEDPERHPIHSEWCQVSAATADAVRSARCNGAKIVAVGTTCVRALETAAQAARLPDVVSPFEGPTDLFILPGHVFRAVDVLITNFHLPRSSLLMLVSAFAGRQRVLAAYRRAVRDSYRFFSFGDAMLIR